MNKTVPRLIEACCLVSDEIRELEETKASRIAREEMKKARWPEPDLEGRRKGDKAKRKIAKLLRRETTMTLGWIAERLQMGTPGYLSHLLYWAEREKVK